MLFRSSILKIPTPVKITKRTGGLISGFVERGYLVDYIGTISGGHSIAFDAKETKGKSLPLKNIHEHQMQMMEDWHNFGATTFLIVYFKDLDEYFRLPFEVLTECWWEAEEGGSKSIPIDTFRNHGVLINKNNGLLDYLGVL